MSTVFDTDAQAGDWFKFFNSSINEKGDVIYDEPEDGAAEVCIRSMRDKLEEIMDKRKRKSEFVLNPTTRSMERVTYFDDISNDQRKADDEAIWDYIITDWKGVMDKSGVEVACTKDNKAKLMRNVPVFNRFVSRCLEMLASAGVKTKEEEVKNS